LTPTTTEERLSETFNPTGPMYIMTLSICIVGLCLGVFCGCIYEVIKRHRKKAKVEPEGTCFPNILYSFFSILEKQESPLYYIYFLIMIEIMDCVVYCSLAPHVPAQSTKNRL
jgi:vacuolar-type H+-ATPase subunit I/STV1